MLNEIIKNLEKIAKDKNTTLYTRPIIKGSNTIQGFFYNPLTMIRPFIFVVDMNCYIEYTFDVINAGLSDYIASDDNSINLAPTLPTIHKVIFNDPATIVLWSDKTKTVVKCGEDDIFDPEKGLAMAISKRLIGENGGRYYEEFKKWLPEEDEETVETTSEATKRAAKAFNDLGESLNKGTKVALKPISSSTTKRCVNCRYHYTNMTGDIFCSVDSHRIDNNDSACRVWVSNIE